MHKLSDIARFLLGKTTSNCLSVPEDCSFGSKELWGHSSISSARRHSGKGAWRNSKGFTGNAGECHLFSGGR